MLEPRPQGRVQWHTVEHIIDVLLFVQILDVLVPQMGDKLLEVFRLLDSQVSEQAIDVPKISQDRIQLRLVNLDLRHAQMAEQLVEMLEFVQFASLLQQQRAEQIIDIPVPRGRRGGGGGLQSFLPVQNSTAPSQQIVDIPVRSGGLQRFSPRTGFNSVILIASLCR